MLASILADGIKKLISSSLHRLQKLYTACKSFTAGVKA
jgi:hypothetical protein